MAIWPKLTARLAIHDPRQPIGPDDLLAEDGAHAVPRIVRFLASDGSPRIGVVRESSQGLPRRVVDLTARHGVGPGLLDFFRASGLQLAERALESQSAAGADRNEVTLAPEELPTRLLSPIDIDAAQIQRGERLVVGFGLTFRSHRAETGGGRPFVFPKPAVPSGAYASVAAGRNDSVALLGRRVLPAGSLLLTGTPGGTAIRAPSRADQVRLVLRSVRHLRWPSEDYRRHLEDHRHAFGFLSPGDRVTGWTTGLGRQEWDVRP